MHIIHSQLADGLNIQEIDAMLPLLPRDCRTIIENIGLFVLNRAGENNGLFTMIEAYEQGTDQAIEAHCRFKGIYYYEVKKSETFIEIDLSTDRKSEVVLKMFNKFIVTDLSGENSKMSLERRGHIACPIAKSPIRSEQKG